MSAPRNMQRTKKLSRVKTTVIETGGHTYRVIPAEDRTSYESPYHRGGETFVRRSARANDCWLIENLSGRVIGVLFDRTDADAGCWSTCRIRQRVGNEFEVGGGSGSGGSHLAALAEARW